MPANTETKEKQNISEGITTRLARDLRAIEKLSAEDTERLRLLILDFFAAACAGYRVNRDFNEAIEKTVLPQGGEAESFVLFSETKYPARTAAFVNTVYGHGAELDDGNKKAAGHAGVFLIPSVFALADKLGSSNEDVLIALATGYEAFVRISSAAVPGLIRRGFHSTGMTGTLAAAAACARLYHLDAQGIEDAIALATTMTGGLLSYGDSRPAIKPLNPANAASNGMFAAMLAAEGVRGPAEALEGKNGWFHAVTDSVNEKCLEGSGHLLIHDCYIKLYPSCRHTHCGIDAAAALRKSVKAEDIQEVRVYIYPDAIRLAGIKMPSDKDETKFSVYYTIARTLVSGSYGLSDMDISKLTPETAELIDAIKLIPDESMEDREKGIRGARVEILDKNGKTYVKEVTVPKGDPENPVTGEEVIEKLRSCADGVVSDDTLEELIRRVRSIGGEDTFIDPVALMR